MATATGVISDRREIVLRSLAGRAIVIRLVFGLVVRLRILLIAPLRPEDPFIWLLTGMAEGVAVSALICIVIIALARGRWADVGRGLLVVVFIVIGLLYLILSEAIVYFGHALHPGDLELGLHPRLLSGSSEGGILARTIVMLVPFIAAMVWADRRARKVTSTGVTIPRLAALVIPGCIALAASPYVNFAETATSPVLQLIELIYPRHRLERTHGAGSLPARTLPVNAIRLLVPPRHNQFVDNRYPLAYMPPARPAAAIQLPAGVRPNIVVILVESLRSAEIGAYGGTIPGLTPNFDSLARAGILIDDAYSVGGYTPEGELGVWYGLLADPYEIVIRNQPEARLSGLPDELRRRRYSLLWSHPGDQSLYLSSDFYARRGFHHFDGTSFPVNAPRTNWGYSDRALMRQTLGVLDRLREPFAAMAVTISNHHPFQLPPDAAPFQLRLPVSESEWAALRDDRVIGQRTIPMFRTIHYSDEALGDFMRGARTTSWFRRTIFIVVGDHGTPTPPLHGVRSVHELMLLRHRVAMLFYSPLLPGGIVIHGPASQVDILPTLYGLLGVTGPRAGVGVDLFDPADRAQERPVISWNPEARTVTVTTRQLAYHGVVKNPRMTPAVFGDEVLIDTVNDPVGLTNLAEQRPLDTQRLRAIARAYIEIYPWLIAEDNSGVPPGE